MYINNQHQHTSQHRFLLDSLKCLRISMYVCVSKYEDVVKGGEVSQVSKSVFFFFLKRAWNKLETF